MGNTYNTKTFRFHFMLIYAVSAIISLSIIIFSVFLVNKFTTRYEQYSTITEPIKYQIQAFNIDVNRQASYMQAYALTGDEKSREQGQQILHVKLPERIETMQNRATRLKDNMLDNKIAEVEKALVKLQEISKSISYQDQSLTAGLIKESYIPLLESFSLHLKELNAYLYEKHTSAFDNIFATIDTVKYWSIAAFMLLMGLFYLVVRKARRFIITRISALQETISDIAKGNVPGELPEPHNELSTITRAINYLLLNLKNVKEFSLHVGKGDFDSNISVFENEGELGKALAGMRQSLKEVSAEDKKRDWINQGLAEFNHTIRLHNNDLTELCYQILSQLVKYVKANQGGIFILNNENHTAPRLQLEASYAYERKKFQEKILEPGQGLVGQAFLEQDKIYLKEIPQNYVNITSGLGHATPTTLFIQPLKVNDEVVGVLELASFREVEPYVQDFIGKVCESLAAAVATARNNVNNRRILEESQELTEQLRAQEEELRQNTEELQATQEEMERRIRELEAENQAFKQMAPQN